VTQQAEGKVVVDFMVSHTGDIKRWILAFGSDIEVLSPKQLRDEIQKEATLMLDKYNREISDPI
jgi:predicted DNA-binding transcriptional regulator YafY